jgi:hypothetical protein
MVSQRDWPLLRVAFDRLNADAIAAAQDIIGRGQVRVSAVRSDLPRTLTAEPVAMLLAKAKRTVIWSWRNEIRADYDRDLDRRSILGPRSNLENAANVVLAWSYGRTDWTIEFRNVRVCWPELVEALAAVGCAVAGRMRSQRKRPKQRDAIDHQPRRGPTSGTTGFNAVDRTLFPSIEKMLKDGEARSVSAAALVLAKSGKVRGAGTFENRAIRLARRYGKSKNSVPTSGG